MHVALHVLVHCEAEAATERRGNTGCKQLIDKMSPKTGNRGELVVIVEAEMMTLAGKPQRSRCVGSTAQRTVQDFKQGAPNYGHAGHE
jgi:hypothetical protein